MRGYTNFIDCKPIQKTLKMLFMKGSGSFLRLTTPQIWKLLVFGNNKYMKILKIFSLKNKSYHNLPEVSKGTVPNTMAVDL